MEQITHEMHLAVTPAPTRTDETIIINGKPMVYVTGPAIGRILLDPEESVRPGEELVVLNPIVTKGGTLT